MTAPTIDPADLIDPRRRIRDREPFRTKASVIRNLQVGDELYLHHHGIPERSRVARILRVSAHQVEITGPELAGGGSECGSFVEWPKAGAFRIDGPRTFTLTHEGRDGERVAGLTFTLLR